MPNSLMTGVSGLLAHQKKLDVVANNLANVNTTGYKTSRVIFADLIYQLMAPATGGNGSTIGGTNPVEIGSGVKAAQITRKFSQGSLEGTGQALDFALQGDGFFVASDGQQDLYTRAGAFSLDQNGFLVDPSTGFFVQRFGTIGDPGTVNPAFQIPGDNRILIPIGQAILGQATLNADLTGILDADAVGPLAEVLTSANPFESGGAPATAATLLNNLDTNLVNYQAGDSITLTGTNDNGTPFSTTTAVNGATTLGDLVTAINGAITGATASVDASGNLVLTANNTGVSMISLAMADGAGNVGSTNLASHSLVSTTTGQAGDTVSGAFEFFDVRGGAHMLGYQFQKVGTNLWDLTYSLNPADGTVLSGPVNSIQFADDGSFVGIGGSPATSTAVTVQLNGIVAQQQFNVSLNNLLQIASGYSLSATQDGFAPGTLSSVRVDSDGTLQGVSTTGRTFDLAQMAIALFRNPQGLNGVGDSYFDDSLNSGPVQIGPAASGGRGTVRSGQLESSNVDVAYEFTQLIVAQRGFSANARTITVSDEVLEELTNIIR